jgi:predicted ATP-grasp superfamily ATP-dependent carboligase
MKSQLPRRRPNPLFTLSPHFLSGRNTVDPCHSWIVEEFISGDEFSCDFVLQKDQVIILRETGKIKASDETFGSILAYRFPPQYPQGFSLDHLCHVLRLAAESLGYTWGHFMADYIIHDNSPYIIEMTPRPGGDSIPDLIKIATGRDLLCMHMDMMSGRPISSNGLPKTLQTFFSVNIYAKEKGCITHLDTSRIISQPCVRALFLKKGVGDRIKLPPDDYDNRLIGYCIITRQHDEDVVLFAKRLKELLGISITP